MCGSGRAGARYPTLPRKSARRGWGARIGCVAGDEPGLVGEEVVQDLDVFFGFFVGG